MWSYHFIFESGRGQLNISMAQSNIKRARVNPTISSSEVAVATDATWRPVAPRCSSKGITFIPLSPSATRGCTA